MARPHEVAAAHLAHVYGNDRAEALLHEFGFADERQLARLASVHECTPEPGK
jgi:hypothetical protein